MKGMPVSQLAEAMFLDAWDYHSNQSSTSEATAKSALFSNNDIRRITEASVRYTAFNLFCIKSIQCKQLN